MNTLMLSCQKATELMEKRQLDGLGVAQNLQLYLHKQMCAGCRMYERQSLFLDSLLHKKAASKTDVSAKPLPEAARKAIQERINKL